MLRHEVAVLRRQVAGLGRPGGPGSAGPAATSRATCPPARQTGHAAGLAPPSDHAQADVPEPARPTAHQPGDPRPHTAAGAASTASRTRSCRNPRRSPCSVRSPAAIASRTSPPDPAAGGRAARPAHPGKSCARAPRPSPRRPGRARSAAPTGQLPSRRAGGAAARQQPVSPCCRRRSRGVPRAARAATRSAATLTAHSAEYPPQRLIRLAAEHVPGDLHDRGLVQRA